MGSSSFLWNCGLEGVALMWCPLIGVLSSLYKGMAVAPPWACMNADLKSQDLKERMVIADHRPSPAGGVDGSLCKQLRKRSSPSAG